MSIVLVQPICVGDLYRIARELYTEFKIPLPAEYSDRVFGSPFQFNAAEGGIDFGNRKAVRFLHKRHVEGWSCYPDQYIVFPKDTQLYLYFDSWGLEPWSEVEKSVVMGKFKMFETFPQ